MKRLLSGVNMGYLYQSENFVAASADASTPCLACVQLPSVCTPCRWVTYKQWPTAETSLKFR